MTRIAKIDGIAKIDDLTRFLRVSTVNGFALRIC